MTCDKILVTIDENGDIGSDRHGKWYIFCASVVADRERYADFIRSRHFAVPPKFKKNAVLRRPVLTDASPHVRAVYYVGIYKSKSRYTSEEQHLIHEKGLGLLSDLLRQHEHLEETEVLIDQTSMIPDSKAESLFRLEKYGYPGTDKVRAVHSCDNEELQTHDFIIGAVGKAFNRSSETYLDTIDAPKTAIFVTTEQMELEAGSESQPTDHADGTSRRIHDSKNKKLSNPKKQGEPASARRSTGHTDSPSRTGSPPGIATGLMGSLRSGARPDSPVVRLGNNDGSDGHKKVSSEPGFLSRVLRRLK